MNINIKRVHVNNETDRFITAIEWMLTVTDEVSGEVLGTENGATAFSGPDDGGEPYVPFNDLTVEQVEGWVLERIDTERYRDAYLARRDQAEKENEFKENGINTGARNPPWNGGDPVAITSRPQRSRG